MTGKKHSSVWRLSQATLLFVLSAMPAVAGTPTAYPSNANGIAAFRSSMIDYFANFGLVPVLATRSFELGDVVQVDGIDFFARGTLCFPHLAASPPQSQELPGMISTEGAGLDVGLGLIPGPIDQNLCAHSRRPMDMMVHGCATSLFQE